MPAHQKRNMIIPEPGLTLDPGQAEDLCELLDHVETITQWLLHAADEVLNDLAQTAYPAHFQPRSAAYWLLEGLIHTRCRLHKTLHHDRLDTTAPIGNQIQYGPRGGGCCLLAFGQLRL